MQQRPSLARRAGAEAIAAFCLVFAGCGAIVIDERGGRALGLLGVSIAFGLTALVMIYAVGHVSGAHMNPAVTCAFTLTRHLPWRDAVVYVTAQCAGATAGALCLVAAWGSAVVQATTTLPSVSVTTALCYEAALTAVLMFVVMAVATDTRAVGGAAAIAVGGAITLTTLFGGPVVGGSVNPARSLGPAIATAHWARLWISLVAPIAGAALGALLYQLVRGDDEGAPRPASVPRKALS
ncbi:MAG TPA: aquaporin [Conexibacter sp.]|nr:aquaporin [Conexibacter sp.]